MQKKNRVSVRIMGQEYKLISDEPHDYMQQVANYVDEKMMEIADGNQKLSTAMVAVLTSLNVADEYFKLVEQKEAVDHGEHMNGDFEGLHNSLTTVQEELEQRNRDYEKMVEDFEMLMDNSSIYEEELQSLREKMNVLSYELNTKEEMLKRTNQTIKELRRQVVDKDGSQHDPFMRTEARGSKDVQLSFVKFEE